MEGLIHCYEVDQPFIASGEEQPSSHQAERERDEEQEKSGEDQKNGGTRLAGHSLPLGCPTKLCSCQMALCLWLHSREGLSPGADLHQQRARSLR